jgi:UDP-glucose 4-epimerase
MWTSRLDEEENDFDQLEHLQYLILRYFLYVFAQHLVGRTTSHAENICKVFLQCGLLDEPAIVVSY